MLKYFGEAPILIVDALDECPNASALSCPREKDLIFVEDLIELQFPNLRLCITSRPEADIKTVLQFLMFNFVFIHDESGQ
jgi:hypothetical protein